MSTPTPTFVAAGAPAVGTAAIPPQFPAGIAVNDILELFIETANEAITIANSNGGTWTAGTEGAQGTGTAGGTSATRITRFWSRYNGTQTAPVTSDSGNHQFGVILAYRGCRLSGDPHNVTSGGIEATSDTSWSITGATTTANNCLVGVACARMDSSTAAHFSAWTNSSLTSITERFDAGGTSGNGGGLGIADGIKATAGAYGATTVTNSTTTTKGFLTFALVGENYLSVDSGTFTETGSTVSLEAGRVVPVAPGSFVETGSNITVAKNLTAKSLLINAGSYAETGSDVALAGNLPVRVGSHFATSAYSIYSAASLPAASAGLTIFQWVKPVTSGATVSLAWGTSADQYDDYDFNADANNVYFWDNTGGGTNRTLTTNNGTWIFLVIRYTDATHVDVGYTRTAGGAITWVLSQQVVTSYTYAGIQIASQGYAEWFLGDCQFVGVVTGAMTDTQISAASNSRRPPANAWAFWTMNIGNATAEISVNGRNMTPSGTITAASTGAPLDSPAKSVVVGAGAYVEAGTAITLTKQTSSAKILPVEAGSYSETGSSIAVRSGYTRTIPAGQFDFWGAAGVCKNTRIVLVGDSMLNASTPYPNTTIAARFPDATVYLEGGGWTGTQELLDNFATHLTAHYSATAECIVVVQVGVNDLSAGDLNIGPTQMLANLTTFCANAHNQGWKIIIDTVLPTVSGDQGANYETYRATINAAIRNGDMVRDAVCDMAARPEFQSAADLVWFLSQGTHWSSAGSLVAGRAMCEAISRIATSAIGLNYSRKLGVAAGSYAESGVAVALKRARDCAVAPVSYLFQNAANASIPLRVVTIGDSILTNTAPTPATTIATNHSGATLWNEAVGGTGTADIISHWSTYVTAHYSSSALCVLFVSTGINDLSSGDLNIGITQYLTNLATICNNAHAAGWKVVVATMTACGAGDEDQERTVGTFESYRRQANDAIATRTIYSDAVVAMHSRTEFQDPNNMTYYDSSHVHLSVTGITLFGGLASSAIDVAIGATIQLRTARKAAPTVGSYVETGTAVTLTATGGAPILAVGAGSYTENGAAVALKRGIKNSISPGNYAMSFVVYSLLRIARKATVAPGSFAVSGQSIALKESRYLTAAPGVYSLNGSSVPLRVAHVVAPSSVAYAVTGYDTALRRNREATIGAGSFAFGGVAVALDRSRVASVQPGSFGFSGADFGLRTAHKLGVSSAAYSMSGSDVGLIDSASGNKTLVVEHGLFGLLGASIGLRATRVMPVAHGVYSETGFDVGLGTVAALWVDVGSGHFDFQLDSSELLTARKARVGSGAFAWTSIDVTLTSSALAPAVTDVSCSIGVREKLSMSIKVRPA